MIDGLKLLSELPTVFQAVRRLQEELPTVFQAVRRLQAENEELRRRIVALEAKPDPFNVRVHINELVEDAVRAAGSPPTPEQVAERISVRSLRLALSEFDWGDLLMDELVEAVQEADWSSKLKELVDDGVIDVSEIAQDVAERLEQDEDGVFTSAVTQALKKVRFRVDIE